MSGYDQQTYLDSCHEPSVYFVQRVNGGPIKIGYSNNVKTRLSVIQPGNPDELVITHRIEGPRTLERILHKAFASDRLHGEWFTASPALAALALAKED